MPVLGALKLPGAVASPRGFGRNITALASRIEIPLTAWQPAA